MWSGLRGGEIHWPFMSYNRASNLSLFSGCRLQDLSAIPRPICLLTHRPRPCFAPLLGRQLAISRSNMMVVELINSCWLGSLMALCWRWTISQCETVDVEQACRARWRNGGVKDRADRHCGGIVQASARERVANQVFIYPWPVWPNLLWGYTKAIKLPIFQASTCVKVWAPGKTQKQCSKDFHVKSQNLVSAEEENYGERSKIKARKSVHWQAQCHSKWQKVAENYSTLLESNTCEQTHYY